MSYGLMMGGAPVSITQQQLGHTNLATTQRYLDHIAPKELVGIKQLLRSPPPRGRTLRYSNTRPLL
jgi:integrase